VQPDGSNESVTGQHTLSYLSYLTYLLTYLLILFIKFCATRRFKWVRNWAAYFILLILSYLTYLLTYLLILLTYILYKHIKVICMWSANTTKPHSHENNGCIAVEWESSKQHVLNVITIVITWRWLVGAETCSEVLRNKKVVSCVCGPHIYNCILYVYIIYGRHTDREELASALLLQGRVKLTVCLIN
jgi:hypothetical protein